MPGSGLHLILADRVLAIAPGAVVDRETRIAYFAGCVAPDMGYCPGGDAFTSDLAHYVRSGELVRSLANSADSAIARAFSRGWATHVVADALIHPLINRGVGALTGKNSRTFADDPGAHVRVEQGLDAVIANRFSASVLWPAGVTAFQKPAVRVLSASYRMTYGYFADERTLAASCRALARSIPILLGYGRILERAFAANGVVDPVLRLAGRATALVPRIPLAGFLGPAKPPLWLVAETVESIEDFPRRFLDAESRGFADLPDFNLDTGTLDSAVDYAPAHATFEELHRCGGAGLTDLRDEGCVVN